MLKTTSRRICAPLVPYALCGVLTVVALSSATARTGSAAPAKARELLEEAGVGGGLIVHLDCGDGRLTAALRMGESYLVQGLDTDRGDVQRAREHIREAGLYGPVSAAWFDGRRLPFAENLVNLIVAEDLGDVSRDEAMRVLAPGGVLLVKADGRWSKSRKPRPAVLDEWTHFLHDASGNPVSRDSVVGPPRRVQWIAEPQHARSHEHLPSVNALVSAGGRIFYIADRTPVHSIQRLPEWHLVARDAFSSTLLWTRRFDGWFPHLINWGQTPPQLQRRMVASDDRVYVTLGLHAPLTAIDAATGEILETYEGTQGAEEILLHEGRLVLSLRQVTQERITELEKWPGLIAKRDSPVHERESAEPLVRRLKRIEGQGQRSILVLDAGSGRPLWKKSGPDVSGMRNLKLCASGDRVVYQKGNLIVCLDLETGEERWKNPCPPLRVVSSGAVVCANDEKVTALSLESGEELWTQPALLVQLRDAFVIGDSLWLGGFKPYEGPNSARRGPSWGPYFATQRSLRTGEVLQRVEPENPGHHHRCWSNKATERYILGGRRGVEFIDLSSGDVLWHSWVRGVCRYGVMPANGLLYAPPHACGCYIAAKLTGFYALAPQRTAAPNGPASGGERLEKGPAYRQGATAGAPAVSGREEGEWPTYRQNPRRSGATPVAVPVDLRRLWQREVGGRLTSPVIARGKVLVASVDQHRLSALDAGSGQPAWHFTAGARVDSAPTFDEGRVIFGSRDGHVYCLRAADGELVWRLRAAPIDRRIVSCGQLEAACPVPGSVLVEKGLATFVAGRSSYLDGGLSLWRVDAATGETISRTPLYSPDPETGRQPPQEGPGYMPGALGEILSSDDEHFYLRDAVFDRSGQPREEGHPHLFALTGFLDDSWAHRTYWAFGTRCSLSTGCTGRDRNLIYGRLIVFDDETIYGFGRSSVHWSNALQDGDYRLFAVKRGETKPRWTNRLPIAARAMLLARDVIFAAGPPAGARGGLPAGEPSGKPSLLAIAASNGEVLSTHPLDAPPVLDGLAAAGGRLYVSLADGRVVCFEGGP